MPLSNSEVIGIMLGHRMASTMSTRLPPPSKNVNENLNRDTLAADFRLFHDGQGLYLETVQEIFLH